MSSSAAPVLPLALGCAPPHSRRPYLAVCPEPIAEAPAKSGVPLASEIIAMIPALRRRAWRWCRNEAETEDLVQETLLRALGVQVVFDSENHLHAWLYTVLRNLFISRRRREQSANGALGQLRAAASQREAIGTASAPFLTLSVERALDSLPEAFACVIRLVDLEEYSYADAAASLGVPIGTVMSRLFRGRQRLAEELADAAT